MILLSIFLSLSLSAFSLSSLFFFLSLSLSLYLLLFSLSHPFPLPLLLPLLPFLSLSLSLSLFKVSIAVVCGGIALKIADVLKRPKFEQMTNTETFEWKDDMEIEVKGEGEGEREREQESKGECVRQGVLLAAGAITGEAMLGILLAIPIIISQNVYVLAIGGGPAEGPLSVALGMMWLFAFSASLTFVDVYFA